jgi:iron complex outermembrane receptor protein
MSWNGTVVTLVAAATAIVGSMPLAAGEAGGLEEIVVTARRTSENLQTVPVAISAFTAESLESKGVDDLVGVARYASNITLNFTAPISGASSALVAYIRGIGQPDFAINFEPGVGIYVDGVYYARTIGSVVDMMDVERVEILKGPQGTLFGRNTIGGAISITTRAPAREFGGKMDLTVGSFNRRDLRGLIDLPLADNLGASVAFASRNRDGYVHRVPFPGWSNNEPSDIRYDVHYGSPLGRLPDGNDLGNENRQTLRTKLDWRATEDIDVLLSADFVRVRENSAPATLLSVYSDAPGVLAGLYNACAAGAGDAVASPLHAACTNVADIGSLSGHTPYDTRFLTGDHRTTYGNAIAGTAIDTKGFSGNVGWRLSDLLAVRSISAYRELDSAFGEDADMSPIAIDHHGFVMKQRQFTQELQLTAKSDRLDGLLGLYYFRESGGIHDFVRLGAGLLQVDGPNTLENRSAAAFGQATWRITHPWSATLGVRYTKENKTFNGRQHDRNALPLKMGAPLSVYPDPSDPTLYFPPGELSQDYSNVSWRAGTEYRFNDDVFAYLSFSEGFKAGGWDTRLTSPEHVVPGFKPETARVYEAGLKAEWLARTLRTNLAVYHTDYRDLQLIIQKGISPLTANAGRSRIQGVEAEIQWLPVPSLLLNLTYGLIDGKYTELDPAANTSGIFLVTRFANTPRSSVSGAVDYTQNLGGRGSLSWHADYSWRSDVYNDAVNTPLLHQGSFGLVTASLTWTHPDGKWSVGIGGNNLTNEDYMVTGFNQPGVGYTIGAWGAPREWWSKLQYRF